MRALNRKLYRDLWHLRGQMIAIALVVACGVAVFVSTRAAYQSLQLSRDAYYAEYGQQLKVAFQTVAAPVLTALLYFAIFSQVRGAIRDDGGSAHKAPNNTLILFKSKYHWAWFIPIDREVVSVGVVIPSAYFIDKLKNTPDGDGTLLDHSLVMYGSPMGDSHVHEHKRLPVFLAGHANGAVKGRLHLKCPPGTPMANLLLTILNKLGVDDVDHVGDSTGTLSI